MRIPLSPPPGIDSDDTTFAAEGRWADGSNVRFSNGMAQTIRGQVVAFALSSGSACMAIGSYKDSTGASYVAYGTTSTLSVGVGIAAPADITPVGLPGSWSQWSLQPYGTTLLACPGSPGNSVFGTIYQYTGSGVATEITQAPDNIIAMLVTNERQVLAFGCNQVASPFTFNRMCIRGSDLEDPTNWTPSSANNSFEHVLDGPGAIVAARKIGSYVAVWTDTALYLGQFLGDPLQTYRFDLVAEGAGLIAFNAVAIYQQTAYWVGPDLRLKSWSPGSLPIDIPCPIQKDFTDNLDRGRQGFCILSILPSRGEIWIHYPDTRDTILNNRCTRYIAYCADESAMAQRPVWFRGAMNINAVLDSTTLTPILGSYDAGAYLASSGLNIRVQEHGTVATAGVSLNWFIQSADQYIGSAETRMLIRGMVPDFKDQVGNVTLTLFLRNRPQSASVTKGPYTIATTDTKKDFRASGNDRLGQVLRRGHRLLRPARQVRVRRGATGRQMIPVQWVDITHGARIRKGARSPLLHGSSISTRSSTRTGRASSPVPRRL
jgi:hypothetical protein